ncbi:hypothetical protein SDC9_73428 [bioreactor metagenome]|uniref:Uncharacterized protein n=1 Tax=bioreactor metagenome TaxID=1076179 RepID=A0A644YKA0_9ZZZZ
MYPMIHSFKLKFIMEAVVTAVYIFWNKPSVITVASYSNNGISCFYIAVSNAYIFKRFRRKASIILTDAAVCNDDNITLFNFS